jgi:hypothetical protein
MPSRNLSSKSGILGVSLLLACALAQAAPVTFFATQAPKAPLTSATPPTLNSSMSTQLAGFNAAITSLGRNEYESGANAGPGTFSYAGGTATATLTGGAVVGVAQSSASLGRYNMTSPVAPTRSRAA